MSLPFHTHERGVHYRLQAIDRSWIGSPLLYLAGGHADQQGMVHHDLRLAPDEWLGGGTFRNSFYTDPWARLTRVRDLSLVVEAVGSLRIRVMQAAPGQPAQMLREKTFSAAERSRMVIALGSPLELPAASRLFWHVDALDGGQLHEAAWCTRTEPGARPAPRLAVLMRTFGRADDVRALLRRLADSAAGDRFHAALLARMDFWVLDASPGGAQAWQALSGLGLNLRIWQGPNLGGGGNAAAVAQQFLAASPERDTAEEALLLDDDLSLSMETLARYLAFCEYREQDAICSLPVLMKSRPTTVWEDGGHWGRDGTSGPAAPGQPLPRRGFGPHLVRHGLSLNGFERLDDFGPLNRCEYATFIFFGLPTRALRQLGLPAAMFLRGDDIEFSLRAGTLGLPVFTNPNLAAWHEPGHSYAQEHMAVLHGMLINLAYSTNAATDYAGFFEQRMTEHAALDDLEGLALYLGVLEALLDPQSVVLTPDFTRHYQQVLPRLNAIPLAPLPERDREAAASAPGATRPAVLPFIYPGYHPRSQGTAIAATADRPPVMLHNPSAGQARAVAAAPALERLALQARYIAALQRWHAEFDVLKERWTGRLAASGRAAFWQEVLGRHAGSIQPVLSERGPGIAHAPPETPQRVASAPVATAAPPPVQPLRELRDRLEGEIARWTQMRLSAERSQRAAQAPRGQPRPWWGGWLNRPLRQLPADFDPATYLALNADVARSGVDPTQHYLRYGHLEGRRYHV